MVVDAPHLMEQGDVLLVFSQSSVRDSLCDILSGSRCGLFHARTRGEAVTFLRAHDIGVVLSDADLPDGNWKDLLNQIEAVAKPPFLIVCSRLADEQMWAEVLNLGGYDLLLTPFDRGEVVRVCTQAWLAWTSKHTAGSRKPPKSTIGESLAAAS